MTLPVSSFWIRWKTVLWWDSPTAWSENKIHSEKKNKETEIVDESNTSNEIKSSFNASPVLRCLDSYGLGLEWTGLDRSGQNRQKKEEYKVSSFSLSDAKLREGKEDWQNERERDRRKKTEEEMTKAKGEERTKHMINARTHGLLVE